MSTYWPAWFNKLTEGQKKFALQKRGFTFVYKFLFKKGSHLAIIGTTGSGKTQAAYWVADFISTTKEIVIWIDSAKNGEMLPLLTMGKPVNIICPKGCDVILSEWSKEENKYVRMKNHPVVVRVPDPGSAWWAIKKNHINIFCFRIQFSSENVARDWMGTLFKEMSDWLKSNRMPNILPFCLFGDESHWFIAGEKVTTEQKRRMLAELITELTLENRAYGARLALMMQSHKSLPPASRENMINTLVKRGCKVSPDENSVLSQYNQWTSKYKPSQGTFVYSDGYAYPANEFGIGYPWDLPFYPKPKIRIEYIGQFDSSDPVRVAQEEIDQEMIPDMSKYQALSKDLEGYKIPATINRYEVITDD
jgi:energy-coupling factor transporter ATP-binding protein EcfA2